MRNTLVTKSLVALAALAALGGGASMAVVASAQTPTGTATATPADWHRGPHDGMMGPHGPGQGVMGTVSSVSGNTLTVTKADGTTYTVDAANAKISKMTELTVGDIKVGDTVGVEGTVSGTSVTAMHIMDGVPPRPITP